MYKVLWIDDEYKDPEMIQFAIEAENQGLLLDGFSSFEEGFEALEKNIECFDVILLDGLFFERKGQVAGTEDEIGIGRAIAKINQLRTIKVFPWFVLSGKEKFTQGENLLLKANEAKCFDKTNPSDVVALFQEMKTAASLQPDAQLKFKYAALLDICAAEFLGEEQFSRLFSLVKHIDGDSKIRGGEDELTLVRKIMEGLIYKLTQYEIIPRQLIGEKGWINRSGNFLAGRHTDYEVIAEIVPPLVAFNVQRLLEIIQDGSHAYGELKYNVDSYIKEAKSDYLFRSTIFLLFDILLWFKSYIDSNRDIEINKSRWKSKLFNGDWIAGTVTEINEKGWGSFQPENTKMKVSIPPGMVSEFKLNKSEPIKVIIEPSQDGTKPHIKLISREI